jgi:hypothetical protein
MIGFKITDFNIRISLIKPKKGGNPMFKIKRKNNTNKNK